MLCLRPTVQILTLCLFVFLFSEYVPVLTTTYRVQTKYRPSTYWYILVKVLKLQVQTSTFWVVKVLQGYILRYSMKPLVLVCSGTYLLVMWFMIQEKLTFQFGTRYLLICTALLTVQIRMYRVPNLNVDFSWIVNRITRRYVQLQTSTSSFVLYLSMYHCSTVP